MILYISATSGNNLKLAKQLQAIGEQFGGEHKLIDLAALDFPLFSSLNEKETPNASIFDLRKDFQEATAFVFCAPEYNGGIPPVLSNALAWLSKCDKDWRSAFNRKQAVIATHSAGPAFKVMQAMSMQLQHLGVTVLARHLTTDYNKALNIEAAHEILEQLAKR